MSKVPFALTAALLLTGCTDVLAFDLTAEVDEFTVPGDPHLHHSQAPLEVGTVPAIELQLGTVSADRVSIAALRFVVTPTSMADEDDIDGLDFLTGLDVYLVPLDRESTLPTLHVASWRGPLEEGAKEIDLIIETDFDLSPYIQQGFRLQADSTGVVPYDDVSLRGEATFRIQPI